LVTLWSKPYWATRDPGAAGLYRPLLMFVFALLWNAGLQFPIWFHLLAVAAHTIATLLVWRLLRCAAPRWPSAIAALWFAVHPLHIEAVASIVNSAEVFATIATLAMVLLVARADTSTPSGQRVSWATAAMAGALYGAGVLFKESGSTAPALALLAVWGWRDARTESSAASNAELVRAAWHRWNRFCFACAAVLLVVVAARMSVLGSAVSRGSIAAPGLAGLTTPERLWAVLSLGPKVLELLVWPRTLNPLYGPHVLAGRSVPTISAALFITIALGSIAVAIRLAKRGDRRVAVGIAWAVIAFLPASNLLLPTGQILAERTLYLPSVGTTLVFVVLLAAAHRRIARVAAAGARRAAVLAVVGVLVLAIANTTRQRSRAWQNHDAWFRQLVKANPDDPRAYLALAVYQHSRGQARDALTQLDHAYSLEPRDSLLLKEYATQLLEQRQAVRAASVASGLMSWPERRRDGSAQRLYLDAMGAAYGADSVLAVGHRLSQDAPTSAAWWYIGLAHEARGEKARAVTAYSKGLELAAGDSIAMARFRSRIEVLSQ
jgi:tetratricopeptide (TPR) repeat protein